VGAFEFAFAPAATPLSGGAFWSGNTIQYAQQSCCKTLNRRHPEPCRVLGGKAKDLSYFFAFAFVAAAIRLRRAAFEFAFAFVPARPAPRFSTLKNPGAKH